MKTIQECVEHIIRKTPFIEEALHDKLINVSSLARMMHGEVEKTLRKTVKEGAIMMAINRLSSTDHIKIKRRIKKFVTSLGDFIVRSDLCDYTFKNTPSLLRNTAKLLQKTGNSSEEFFTISQGVYETNIVLSKNLQPEIDSLFADENIICSMKELASITIKLPKSNTEDSGIYYFIMKQFAWADLSIQEVISTTNEITLVVKEKDINKAFAILMDIKKS
ncbi:MAG: hypothetical protein HRT66_00960 [Flavobacteriaceae bacterium]|nr:hypothetical protein [Flavobacteriaceae bacterium]